MSERNVIVVGPWASVTLALHALTIIGPTRLFIVPAKKTTC